MKQKQDVPSTSIDMASLLKSLEGLSPSDQVDRLSQRVVEAEQLNAKLKEKANLADKLQKSNAMMEKKLDKANHILVRTEESKGKMEELCRELQKYNKQIREDSASKIRQLETERQAAVTQLKVHLQDIEKSMQSGRERSDSLAAENVKMGEKLHQLGAEYQERLEAISKQYKSKDRYYEEFNKTKELEAKLLSAKLEAAQCNIKKLSLEKEELTNTLLESTARLGVAVENERLLKEQVSQYSGRYSELTESISASNQAFDKFKKEIDRVNANLRKMETDALKWKRMYDEASKNVLVLTMSKKELDEQAAVSLKKIDQLEKLCRALSGRQAPPTSGEDDQAPPPAGDAPPIAEEPSS